LALYIVGGFVRDLLLDRPSLDFDLVVEGDAIMLARALVERYGGRFTSHARFNTAKWHLDKYQIPEGEKSAYGRSFASPLHSIDLVTARTEFYTHPSALPTVERSSIKLDLHRRDFTINTLALRLDGRHYGDLYDYWGGHSDLRQGLVRVLHSLSFVDDPTRILRAVRFEQRFSFSIEERTMELLQEARPLIDRLSGDRIRHELNHILAENLVTLILARLDELHLLEAIHPNLAWDEWLRVHIETLAAMDLETNWELDLEDRIQLKRDLIFTLWMLRLSPMQARAVIKRLKLSTVQAKVILSGCQLWRDRESLAKASPSAAVARLEDTPPLARYALYVATSNVRIRDILKSYATRWRKISPATDGNDLKALGLPPGPAYRQILESLRDAWLDGEITSVEQEKIFLEELLHEK
jgi:tRNA nucleotidyltransferase (CCA-adding enzyme)